MRELPKLLVLTLLLTHTSPSRADTIVTACGQEVSGSGVLAGDLVCGNTGVIVRSGRIDLAGFSILAEPPIECFGTCRVFSSLPGATVEHTGPFVVGAIQTGTGVDGGVRMDIRDVTIARGGVWNPEGRTRIENVTFPQATSPYKNQDNEPTVTARILKARDVAISGQRGVVIRADASAKLERVTIDSTSSVSGDPNSLSVVERADRITLKASAFTQNEGTCIGETGGARVKLTETTIAGCSVAGMDTVDKVVLRDSSVTGAGLVGIQATSVVKLKRSSATGSGTDAACGVTELCADLYTSKAKLDPASVCDTSRDLGGGGGSLGICLLD